MLPWYPPELRFKFPGRNSQPVIYMVRATRKLHGYPQEDHLGSCYNNVPTAGIDQVTHPIGTSCNARVPNKISFCNWNLSKAWGGGGENPGMPLLRLPTRNAHFWAIDVKIDTNNLEFLGRAACKIPLRWCCFKNTCNCSRCIWGCNHSKVRFSGGYPLEGHSRVMGGGGSCVFKGFTSKIETDWELCHYIKFQLWPKLIDASSDTLPWVVNWVSPKNTLYCTGLKICYVT